jgi:Uncharacterized protein conserved in cyanobacteria
MSSAVPAAAAQTSVRPVPAPPLTYEEFLEWADEDTYAEWVGGEVVFMSPASLPHQNLSDFLTALLRLYVEDHDLGQILSAPFQMRLARVNRGREPDILFVARENAGRLQRNFLDGPADLVIEIVSPESALRDRGEKYAEYEAEGVGEYWLLDPDTARADFFILGTDGRYERVREDAQGIYRSAVVTGFWLNVTWLWQSPLPRLRDVLNAQEPNSG